MEILCFCAAVVVVAKIMVCGEFTNKALKNNIYLELYNKNLFLPTSNVGNVSYLQRVFSCFFRFRLFTRCFKICEALNFCSLEQPLEHPVDLELI